MYRHRISVVRAIAGSYSARVVCLLAPHTTDANIATKQVLRAVQLATTEFYIELSDKSLSFRGHVVFLNILNSSTARCLPLTCTRNL